MGRFKDGRRRHVEFFDEKRLLKVKKIKSVLAYKKLE